MKSFFGFKRRSASVGVDTRPKYMIPPSRPFNPPFDRRDTMETAIKSRLQTADDVAVELPKIYKQAKATAEKQTGKPNAIERLIFLMDPSTIPDSEISRRQRERNLAYLANTEQNAVNNNLGLVSAEARGITRDVVLNHISPFLQPTKEDHRGYLRTIQDDTLHGTHRGVMANFPQLLEYPDVPITEAQSRVLNAKRSA